MQLCRVNKQIVISHPCSRIGTTRSRPEWSPTWIHKTGGGWDIVFRIKSILWRNVYKILHLCQRPEVLAVASSAWNTLSLYIPNLLSNVVAHPFPFDPMLRFWGDNQGGLWNLSWRRGVLRGAWSVWRRGRRRLPDSIWRRRRGGIDLDSCLKNRDEQC